MSSSMTQQQLLLQRDFEHASARQASSGDDMQGKAAQRARELIERAQGSVTLMKVAEEVGLSSRYLHGVFKKAFGVTPGAYAENLRRAEGHTRKESDGRQQQEKLAELSVKSRCDSADNGMGNAGLDDSISAAQLDTLRLTPLLLDDGQPAGFASWESLLEADTIYGGDAVTDTETPSFTPSADSSGSTPAAIAHLENTYSLPPAQGKTVDQATEHTAHDLGIESLSLPLDRSTIQDDHWSTDMSQWLAYSMDDAAMTGELWFNPGFDYPLAMPTLMP
ncbi:hypothetical protein H2199_006615 [Coniosporium tulheliwenetii]|uniref:Uncharacterized protein n=1 Tax=Coniosporium tulheliwenetii TaxID=3383036 RepID=A0ACC2YU19_9PEZI|nr:hypothetical protein H2199_006615 [Cladosporium sp. JES 115]